MSGALTTTWEVAQTPNLCHILCHPWALKGICFGFRTPSHIAVGAPSQKRSKKGQMAVRCCSSMCCPGGHDKTECYNHFGALNLDQRTDQV